jgi:hypothetical protein
MPSLNEVTACCLNVLSISIKFSFVSFLKADKFRLFTVRFVQHVCSSVSGSHYKVVGLGSFSWLVPRRIIKEITELEKLHVVRSTKNYQSSLSNYSPLSSFLGFQIMATTSHMYLVGF